ncbi:hypothetical protein TSAR_012414 [Trichomalopsis sarcophagae]|uniref:Uncharacterized protein n=1 Tax=Trichomalopsis sarcophagae TaxID=543379 RepID=A0A232F475_9HYME|nr:hypothetical protein TSAR_012414 [Trichomalopsis sarcophagae]
MDKIFFQPYLLSIPLCTNMNASAPLSCSNRLSTLTLAFAIETATNWH